LKQVAERGITPLQVMLENMRALYAQGDLLGAHKAAVDCAPYIHAKLVSSKVTVRRPDEMSDEELLSSIEVADEAATSADVRGSVSAGAGETRH
jgi:hypothetical protein